MHHAGTTRDSVLLERATQGIVQFCKPPTVCIMQVLLEIVYCYKELHKACTYEGNTSVGLTTSGKLHH